MFKLYYFLKLYYFIKTFMLFFLKKNLTSNCSSLMMMMMMMFKLPNPRSIKALAIVHHLTPRTGLAERV